jgi:thymidylate synthase ThyX/thymidylate kinase
MSERLRGRRLRDNLGQELAITKSGIYVVLDGPQGAGKTTISDYVIERGIDERVRFIRLHEPHFRENLAPVDSDKSSLVNDSLRETIMMLLKRPDDLSEYALAKLYNQFRLEEDSGMHALLEATERGVNVISDRSWLSTLVNQVALGKMTEENAREIYEEFVVINQIISPSLTLIIERDWELVEASLAQDGYNNAYRKRGRYYFEKSSEVYRAIGEHLGLSFLKNNGDIEDAVGAVQQILGLMIEFDNNLAQVKTAAGHDHIVTIGKHSLANVDSIDSLPRPEDIRPKYIDEKGRIMVAGEELLSKIFSTPDRGTYLILPHVPHSFSGSVMGRLSRTHLGLRQLILTEFLEEAVKIAESVDVNETKNKAAALYERVYSGFGDDSVGQLWSIHFMVEGASAIAIKELESYRLAAYLEQSTRYIPFNERGQDGKYRYHIPDVLTPEGLKPLRDQYIASMDQRFDDYGRVFERVFSMLQDRESKEGGAIYNFRAKYINDNLDAPTEGIERAVRIFINGPIRARALDAARNMLPIATVANVGVSVSSQEFEYMIVKMRASKNKEVRDMAESLLSGAKEHYGATVKRVDLDDRGVKQTAHFRKVDQEMADVVQFMTELYGDEAAVLPEVLSHEDVIYNRLQKDGFFVKIKRSDKPAIKEGSSEEIKSGNRDDFFDPIIEHILCTIVEGMSEARACAIVKKMNSTDKQSMLQACMGDHIENRRNKTPRAFETISFSVEMVVDYGIFRDLQRHRLLTVDWPKVTPAIGYKPAHGDIQAVEGLEDIYDQSFRAARELYDQMMKAADGMEDEILKAELTESAQEALLMGTYMRSNWNINFRSLIHILELRTQPAGHEGYRKVCQELFRQLCVIAPWMGDPDNLDQYGIPQGGILQLIVNMTMDPDAIGRAAEHYKNNQLT